jgi:hypothetical protein
MRFLGGGAAGEDAAPLNVETPEPLPPPPPPPLPPPLPPSLPLPVIADAEHDDDTDDVLDVGAVADTIAGGGEPEAP